MKLRDLAVDKKTAWFECPYGKGFKVHLTILSRKALVKLYEDNVIVESRQNPVTKIYEDHKVLNMETYTSQYAKETILGWTGFKLGYLEGLGVFDIGDANPEEEIPYTPEDATDLMTQSKLFDEWVSGVVNDVSNFRTKRKTGTVEKNGAVAELATVKDQ